jgi:hypothetical protein
MDLERKTNKILVKIEKRDDGMHVKIPDAIVKFLDLKGDEFLEIRGKIKGVTGEKRKIGMKVTDVVEG